MYVGNANSDDVSVIDSPSNTVIATVDVGDTPLSIEFNPSNNNMYVISDESPHISVIDTV